MYLLDTNVVSELRKHHPHGGVVEWVRATPETSLHLSAVTIGEIQAGIEKTRDLNPTKASEIEAWLDQIVQTYAVLPADGRVFRSWAQLLHRQPRHHSEDALIAATALVHGFSVVTRNTEDFRAFGVPLINPFKTPAFKTPAS